MSKAKVSNIRVYPIKALDPIELTESEVALYSLKHDREFAILADDGRFVNSKRTGRVNQLQARFNMANYQIKLGLRGSDQLENFELRAENPTLDQYLSDFFDLKVKLVQNLEGSLMDMPRVAAVTILSNASLLSLQNDLGDYTLEDLRLRFRANIELEGVEAYWEEQLFAEEKTGIRFKLGETEMIGLSPRARCNVPPRDPWTGETDKLFVKNMMDSRAKTLSPDSLLHHYKNLYYLSINTHIAENQKGKLLKLGDELEILEKVYLK